MQRDVGQAASINPFFLNLENMKQLIILVVFIYGTNHAIGQRIENLTLDNRLSILNDKAFFNFPSEAKNVARQTDIMSADPNTFQETRIIYDRDKQRLVFFARELFVTSDKNLLKTISDDKDNTTSVKSLADHDSIISVLSTPHQFDSTKSAILINNLYVRTQDNSVFVIGAYINPDAFKDVKEYQKLSERVFTSLTKGNRRLTFEQRTETLPIFGGKKKFLIRLPEGFTVTKDKKYDFEVLKFQKIKDIKDTGWVSLTIYTGFHPSYFYGDYEFDEKDAEKPLSNFLGNKVQWLSFKNEERQLHLKEQKIPGDKIEKGLIVHIAMLSNSKQGIDELTRIIENITVTEK